VYLREIGSCFNCAMQGIGTDIGDMFKKHVKCSLLTTKLLKLGIAEQIMTVNVSQKYPIDLDRAVFQFVPLGIPFILY
jgi:hypothetical protein